MKKEGKKKEKRSHGFKSSYISNKINKLTFVDKNKKTRENQRKKIYKE